MNTAHIDTFARDRLPPPEQRPQFMFDRPEYRYHERVNAATELLDGALARGWGQRIALRFVVNDRELVCTYGQLAAQVNRIVRVLTDKLRLVPGNRVLLRGPNHPMFAAAFLAVVKAGLIAVPTMPLLRAHELRTIAEKAQVDAVLCDARLREEVDRLIDAASAFYAPSIKHLMFFNDAAPDSLDARAAHVQPALVAQTPGCKTYRDDVALIAFTSGTTGQPKGTMHFHRDILVMSDAFALHVLKPKRDDIFCGTPPLAFTFGLGGLLTMPLRAGAGVVLAEKLSPESLLSLAARTRATVMFTAPTMYRQMALLLKDGKAAQVASLRRCVSAGEALPDATRTLWREATGIEMIDGIGATEMIHIFISAADHDVRPGCIGKVVPGYEARVVDETMQEVAHGTIGKLAVRGPTGCRYICDERQRQYVRDGWNLTGDSFTMDADGYFTYQARSDDMIVSAGYNIAGPEVEAALLTHPAVAECGVIGVAEEQRGQIVKAFVVLKPGYSDDLHTTRALQDFVKQSIAPYKYPRAIEYVASLPRTETGKLQRFKLRQPAT